MIMSLVVWLGLVALSLSTTQWTSQNCAAEGKVTIDLYERWSWGISGGYGHLDVEIVQQDAANEAIDYYTVEYDDTKCELRGADPCVFEFADTDDSDCLDSSSVKITVPARIWKKNDDGTDDQSEYRSINEMILDNAAHVILKGTSENAKFLVPAKWTMHFSDGAEIQNVEFMDEIKFKGTTNSEDTGHGGCERDIVVEHITLVNKKPSDPFEGKTFDLIPDSVSCPNLVLRDIQADVWKHIDGECEEKATIADIRTEEIHIISRSTETTNVRDLKVLNYEGEGSSILGPEYNSTFTHIEFVQTSSISIKGYGATYLNDWKPGSYIPAKFEVQTQGGKVEFLNVGVVNTEDPTTFPTEFPQPTITVNDNNDYFIKDDNIVKITTSVLHTVPNVKNGEEQASILFDQVTFTSTGTTASTIETCGSVIYNKCVSDLKTESNKHKVTHNIFCETGALGTQFIGELKTIKLEEWHFHGGDFDVYTSMEDDSKPLGVMLELNKSVLGALTTVEAKGSFYVHLEDSTIHNVNTLKINEHAGFELNHFNLTGSMHITGERSLTLQAFDGTIGEFFALDSDEEEDVISDVNINLCEIGLIQVGSAGSGSIYISESVFQETLESANILYTLTGDIVIHSPVLYRTDITCQSAFGDITYDANFGATYNNYYWLYSEIGYVHMPDESTTKDIITYSEHTDRTAIFTSLSGPQVVTDTYVPTSPSWTRLSNDDAENASAYDAGVIMLTSAMGNVKFNVLSNVKPGAAVEYGPTATVNLKGFSWVVITTVRNAAAMLNWYGFDDFANLNEGMMYVATTIESVGEDYFSDQAIKPAIETASGVYTCKPGDFDRLPHDNKAWCSAYIVLPEVSGKVNPVGTGPTIILDGVDEVSLRGIGNAPIASFTATGLSWLNGDALVAGDISISFRDMENYPWLNPINTNLDIARVSWTGTFTLTGHNIVGSLGVAQGAHINGGLSSWEARSAGGLFITDIELKDGVTRTDDDMTEMCGSPCTVGTYDTTYTARFVEGGESSNNQIISTLWTNYIVPLSVPVPADPKVSQVYHIETSAPMAWVYIIEDSSLQANTEGNIYQRYEGSEGYYFSVTERNVKRSTVHRLDTDCAHIFLYVSSLLDASVHVTASYSSVVFLETTSKLAEFTTNAQVMAKKVSARTFTARRAVIIDWNVDRGYVTSDGVMGIRANTWNTRVRVSGDLIMTNFVRDVTKNAIEVYDTYIPAGSDEPWKCSDLEPCNPDFGENCVIYPVYNFGCMWYDVKGSNTEESRILNFDGGMGFVLLW